jgi:hypothetical protein
MKYAGIGEHRDQYTVSRLCRVLQVSRSGYCQWRVRPPSCHLHLPALRAADEHRAGLHARHGRARTAAMTGNGITHGPHDALIGQWPASTGHSCAWRLHRHRGPPLAGCRWLVRSGAPSWASPSGVRGPAAWPQRPAPHSPNRHRPSRQTAAATQSAVSSLKACATPVFRLWLIHDLWLAGQVSHNPQPLQPFAPQS